MDALIKHIADIIRPRCISDASATLAAIDVITWINDSRNRCECPSEIKTGWVTQKQCNICGRPERRENITFYRDLSTCELCGSHIDDVRGCVGCGHIVE